MGDPTAKQDAVALVTAAFHRFPVETLEEMAHEMIDRHGPVRFVSQLATLTSAAIRTKADPVRELQALAAEVADEEGT